MLLNLDEALKNISDIDFGTQDKEIKRMANENGFDFVVELAACARLNIFDHLVNYKNGKNGLSIEAYFM